jgi:prevent-host-death family protein
MGGTRVKRVAIASLKSRLSEYLKAVRAGEEITVTDRGRPIARLTPLAREGQEDARLTELIEAGLARLPLEPLSDDFWTLPRPADPEGRALQILLEERRDGR